MIRKDADLDALLALGIEFWRKEKNSRIAKERIWQECWLAYDSKFGDTWQELENYRSKRYISLPWLAVENVNAKYVQSVFPDETAFSLTGRTPVHDNSARFMQALMEYQHKKSRFRQKFASALKQALIFGNVPYQVKWDHHTTPIPDEQGFQNALDQAGMSIMQGQEVPNEMPEMPTKELTLYDGPDFEIGNIFDFVIERNPSSYERAMRAARFIKSKAYLLDASQPDEFGQQLYEGLDDLEEQSNNTETSDSLRFQVESQIGFNAQDQRKGIELIEIWGDFSLDDSSYFKNHVLTIANRTKVVRFEQNPFYHGLPPWQMFRLVPEPNEPYGRGVLEPVLGNNDALQVRINQVIDCNNLIINPKMGYVEDGVFDPAVAEDGPGAFFPMRQPGNVFPIAIPSDTALGFNEFSVLQGLFNQISGATSILQSASKDPASATQASIEAQMSNARDAEVIAHIESDFFQRILEMEYKLNQQFMQQPQALRIAGDPLMQGIMDPASGLPLAQNIPAMINVSPDDIAGDFDIVTHGARDVAAQAQQGLQLLQLFGTLMQSPQAAPYVKPFEFFSEIFQRFGIKDAWKFVKTQQEVMLEQQQQMAMQAAAGGPGAGPGAQGAAPGTNGPTPGGGPASLSGAPESRPPQPGGSSPAQRSGPSLA